MSFSFLNPSLLYALPLLAVPIIIHLFSIKKAKVVKFPETKFIKLAVKQTLTKIRLWQLLLLILRILMIIILVLIFARPVMHIQKNAAGGTEDPQALCLILDNSYSMGALYKNKSSFERGKEVCKKILGSLKDCDSVSFALMAEGANPKTRGFTPDFLKVEELINNSALSFNTTSVAAGLNFGFGALKELPVSNKQIIIVSDFALHGFAAKLRSIKDFDRNVKVIFVDISEKVSNIALSDILASSSTLDEHVKISFAVENASDKKYIKAPVSLVMNGVKSAYGFIDSYPGKRSAKSLYFNAEKGRDDAGYVRLEAGDALAADNTAYVTALAPEKSKVLLVDGDVKIAQFQNETFFLRLALNPDQRFPGEVLPYLCVPGELAGKNLYDYKVIFLCNVEKLSAAVEERLKEYLAAGGNIVYFLGDRVNIATYSMFSDQLFPAFINGSEEGVFKLDTANTSVNHPVFKQVSSKELEKATVYRHYILSPKQGCFAVASFEGGLPFMLEQKGAKNRKGKVVIFPFPVDREWSDFPMRTGFLPFMQELAKYLSENVRKENTGSIFIGELFKKTFPLADFPVRVELTVPGGSPAGYTMKSNVFEFAGTNNPGIYTMKYQNRKGERRFESFAVNLNVPSGESDLKKQDLSGLKKALPENTGVFLIKDYKNIETEVAVLLRGREITFPLLIILLFLLTIEGILSIRRFL